MRSSRFPVVSWGLGTSLQTFSAPRLRAAPHFAFACCALRILFSFAFSGTALCCYVCLCCGIVICDWAGFRSGSGSLLVQTLLQNICTSVDSLSMLQYVGCDVFMFLWFWCLSLEVQRAHYHHNSLFLRRGECFAPHLTFACQEWVLQVKYRQIIQKEGLRNKNWS